MNIQFAIYNSLAAPKSVAFVVAGSRCYPNGLQGPRLAAETERPAGSVL